MKTSRNGTIALAWKVPMTIFPPLPPLDVDVDAHASRSAGPAAMPAAPYIPALRTDRRLTCRFKIDHLLLTAALLVSRSLLQTRPVTRPVMPTHGPCPSVAAGTNRRCCPAQAGRCPCRTGPRD